MSTLRNYLYVWKLRRLRKQAARIEETLAKLTAINRYWQAVANNTTDLSLPEYVVHEIANRKGQIAALEVRLNALKQTHSDLSKQWLNREQEIK